MSDNEGTQETVLVGCEVLCIAPETGLIGCPLPPEEIKTCKSRLQYQAGMEEVIAWVKSHSRETQYWSWQDWYEWRTQLKEWGIGG